MYVKPPQTFANQNPLTIHFYFLLSRSQNRIRTHLVAVTKIIHCKTDADADANVDDDVSCDLEATVQKLFAFISHQLLLLVMLLPFCSGVG